MFGVSSSLKRKRNDENKGLITKKRITEELQQHSGILRTAPEWQPRNPPSEERSNRLKRKYDAFAASIDSPDEHVNGDNSLPSKKLKVYQNISQPTPESLVATPSTQTIVQAESHNVQKGQEDFTKAEKKKNSKPTQAPVPLFSVEEPTNFLQQLQQEKVKLTMAAAIAQMVNTRTDPRGYPLAIDRLALNNDKAIVLYQSPQNVIQESLNKSRQRVENKEDTKKNEEEEPMEVEQFYGTAEASIPCVNTLVH